ncbi:hypothetical protein QE152_g23124 [Popillia japonica]|uniref:Uncharacterized protein n=1 Tax=Popillia japonica TaxID=7064 RepID=A0AAW1KG91_POPJA
MEFLKKKIKENNVVVSGVEIKYEDPLQIKEQIQSFTRESLGIESKIRDVRKLGPKTCLVELENRNEKRKIMFNKRKLKEIPNRKIFIMDMFNKRKLKEIPNRKIFIMDDLTKRELEMQKKLRSKAIEEKAKGKEVTIGYRKLTIDGVVWRWNGTEEKLERGNAKN